jgi:ZIP family zinc transporter
VAVTVWTAVLWGGLTSASLFLGQALARPLGRRHRITGLVMGFGAGTLLSAIAYQLVPVSGLGNGWQVGGGLVAGALTYYVADELVDRGGGGDRQRIKTPAVDAAGGSISAAFVMAIFVSNVPQGVAGTTSLLAAGWSGRGIAGLWGGLTVACAAVAGVGFASAGALTGGAGGGAGLAVEAFAAGALLMVLADSMIPEAYTHGGRAVGLATVGGYLVATALATAS